jgi:putative ATPase
MTDYQIHKPLAERMRPTDFSNFVGQKHLLKKDGSFLKTLNSEVLPSMIFWGPPGVGKTTLARIIANQSDREFFQLNAVSSGVKDVRQVIEQAKATQFLGTYKKPIVFIDEIHRFSKSQQDSLLHAVENGTICLIGATTENPSFEVISALLSRCHIFTLEELSKDDLLKAVQFALINDEWLKNKNIQLKESNALLRLSGGDARKLLNYLELVVAGIYSSNSQNNPTKIIITDKLVESSIQKNLPKYDKNGENHYDIISAFIKSIRGSHPDAAIYWLARMLEAGEDLKFIARRLLISASEDIGLANPNALLIAQSCFDAVSVIGYPEAEIILSQATIYLATSPKSNASYKAIKDARAFVQQTGDLPVPLHLRNAPTKLMKQLGYGKNYNYSHDSLAKDTVGLQEFGNFAPQDYLPKEANNQQFYQPQNNPKENEIKKNLDKLWDGGKNSD